LAFTLDETPKGGELHRGYLGWSPVEITVLRWMAGVLGMSEGEWAADP